MRIEPPARPADLRWRVTEHLTEWDIAFERDPLVPPAFSVPFALELTKVAAHVQQHPLEFELGDAALPREDAAAQRLDDEADSGQGRHDEEDTEEDSDEANDEVKKRDLK